MEIIIGRRGEQSFPIMDKAVSGKHLKLTTMPDGNVQVEDLGSTNGTFIDGVRIIKKVVSRNTIVQMGSTFTFRVNDVLPEVKTPSANPSGNTINGGTRIMPPTPPTPPTPPKPEYDEEILRKFQNLESVWNKYQEEKINLQKNNASKGFLRMLPMFVLGGLGYLISCIPELADFRTAITLAGLGIGIIITWISYKSATSLPEQMEKLNQQFQIDYVCPKCKQFLGFTPFEGLKNRGQCSACKSKWVKK